MSEHAMSQMPEPKRRRVAPAVTDPMAPSQPAAPPPAAVPAAAAPAAPRVKAAPAKAPVVTSTRRTATVQLATRISTEADVQLHELVASRDTTIRDTIEDLIAAAWRKEVGRK